MDGFYLIILKKITSFYFFFFFLSFFKFSTLYPEFINNKLKCEINNYAKDCRITGPLD